MAALVTVIAVLAILAVIVVALVLWSANSDWNEEGYAMDVDREYAEAIERANARMGEYPEPVAELTDEEIIAIANREGLPYTIGTPEDGELYITWPELVINFARALLASSPALRDVARLYAKYAELHAAMPEQKAAAHLRQPDAYVLHEDCESRLVRSVGPSESADPLYLGGLDNHHGMYLHSYVQCLQKKVAKYEADAVEKANARMAEYPEPVAILALQKEPAMDKDRESPSFSRGGAVNTLLDALRIAREYVQLQNDAEGITDGFGGRRRRPSDADLAMIDEAIAQAKQARNAALDEALAVVPGGSICDPQQVADAIQALKEE